MKKWTARLLVAAVIGGGGYLVYDHWRFGFFDLPEVPEGSRTISFHNGLRAIILDAEYPDEVSFDDTRDYLGIPFKVAPWFEDAWSFCTPATEDERERADRTMPEEARENLRYARLDAVCNIDVDGEKVARGLIYSIPKL